MDGQATLQHNASAVYHWRSIKTKQVGDRLIAHLFDTDSYCIPLYGQCEFGLY